MADLNKLRESIKKRLDVGDRQLLRLISSKELETLLPRDQAIMALAAEHGLSITRFATPEDLAAIRGATGQGAPPAPAQQGSSAQAPVAPTSKRRKPSAGRGGSRPASKKPARPTRGKKVFVVHGRNDALRRDMFDFLRAVGLQPLEWRKGIAATKLPSPSIAQILDALFSQAIAVVVLLTPDDEVRLAERFWKQSDPPFEKELVGQARPNVLFEAGMAFGRYPEQVVLVQVGAVKPFTDVGGLHITHLSNSPESRSELVTKLGNAGCAVDDEGTDWYRTGNFERLD